MQSRPPRRHALVGQVRLEVPGRCAKHHQKLIEIPPLDRRPAARITARALVPIELGKRRVAPGQRPSPFPDAERPNASVSTGVTIATWTAAIAIVVLEFIAGWRSRLGLERLWLQAVLGTLIGFAIIALKLLLH